MLSWLLVLILCVILLDQTRRFRRFRRQEALLAPWRFSSLPLAPMVVRKEAQGQAGSAVIDEGVI